MDLNCESSITFLIVICLVSISFGCNVDENRGILITFTFILYKNHLIGQYNH